MPSPKELYSTFSSFPSKEHVEVVCKRGKGAETCRYLVMSSDYGCAKAKARREVLDRRAQEGKMKAQGDNCSGTLGFIIDNQDLLKGNRTEHREAGYDREGPFDGIRLEDGIFKVAGFSINERFAQIEIRPEGIIFSAPLVGSAIVFFNKPRETDK